MSEGTRTLNRPEGAFPDADLSPEARRAHAAALPAPMKASIASAVAQAPEAGRLVLGLAYTYKCLVTGLEVVLPTGEVQDGGALVEAVMEETGLDAVHAVLYGLAAATGEAIGLDLHIDDEVIGRARRISWSARPAASRAPEAHRNDGADEERITRLEEQADRISEKADRLSEKLAQALDLVEAVPGDTADITGQLPDADLSADHIAELLDSLPADVVAEIDATAQLAEYLAWQATHLVGRWNALEYALAEAVGSDQVDNGGDLVRAVEGQTGAEVVEEVLTALGLTGCLPSSDRLVVLQDHAVAPSSRPTPAELDEHLSRLEGQVVELRAAARAVARPAAGRSEAQHEAPVMLTGPMEERLSRLEEDNRQLRGLLALLGETMRSSGGC